MRALRLILDDNGIPTEYFEASDYIDYRVLAAATAESHTLPTSARYVSVNPMGADVFLSFGGTAAVPAADVTDGSGDTLVQDGERRLFRIDGALSLISSGTPTVMLEYYD